MQPMCLSHHNFVSPLDAGTDGRLAVPEGFLPQSGGSHRYCIRCLRPSHRSPSANADVPLAGSPSVIRSTSHDCRPPSSQ
ncbi:hypothetical protein GUJ93_ZPchr0003g17024 [Zizania palustris]|uniref:Uncharacterized protein n=1 Tax=Zizania palustris TaxID=103762 RepID=A0A8J5VER4_ZIZPA|nr:hypothetical protein GUJ93_ZPchr0003g17024 [Zizania palustris]KAG8063691.1 hypothetical protein GUJ93_ZPchr0003g17024 [Zizania palustris]KAG8063692.1 hypothetical protein GUJ93_ZPchr0003g17024 [Zizania palustris]